MMEWEEYGFPRSMSLKRRGPTRTAGSADAGKSRRRARPTPESSSWQDAKICYREYKLSWKEWLLYGAAGEALAVLIDFIFYRSLVFFLLLSPLAVIFPWAMRGRLAKKRRDRLGVQFRDAVLALSSALQAGYSVENAWREAYEEMACVYGEEGMITREFARMVRAIEVNETPESVISEFAARSGLPEAESFAEVFCLAKRSSGDLVTVMDNTARTISEKLRVREEIATLTAAKQLEETVMTFIPAGIILYLNFSFDGFMDVLYQGLAGRAVMTVCLLIYGCGLHAEG